MLIKKFKIVMVGDESCGKTSLKLTFAKSNFPGEYLLSEYEKEIVEIIFEEKMV